MMERLRVKISIVKGLLWMNYLHSNNIKKEIKIAKKLNKAFLIKKNKQRKYLIKGFSGDRVTLHSNTKYSF